MATTIAQISLSSSDLISNTLALSDTATLTAAGGVVGLTQTTGVGRTNFTENPIIGKTIYRSDDAADDGSNKIYLKNLSATASQFFTVYIGQTEMGRLYAGDWTFFPWIATDGVKGVFEVTVGGTLAVDDRWRFDGVTTTSSSTTPATFAVQVSSQFYPNWTTAVAGAVVTFTAKKSGQGPIIDDDELLGDTILDMASGDLTMVIDNAVAGTATSSDIIVVPSVVTTMDLEHILFHE